jgi:H2-forming N5,N10-methylenetetrahydromethanopterin dehydrogenase-like enzyme
MNENHRESTSSLTPLGYRSQGQTIKEIVVELDEEEVVCLNSGIFRVNLYKHLPQEEVGHLEGPPPDLQQETS